MGSQFLFSILLIAVFSFAHAQEVLVVEASRLAEEAPMPSPQITVLNRSFIEKENKTSMADLLREVPGLEVVRQGAFGQPTSLFIRGSRSEDVLVLIDGIEVNDSLAPSGAFDFSNLSTQNVERVEIYRGPQTTRFGPGALGGVIQIITRDGIGRNQKDYKLEAGSYGTLTGELDFAKGGETFGASLGLQEFKSDGFSAADRHQGNSEIDSSRMQSVSSKFSWKPDLVSRIDLVAHHRQSQVDSDFQGGPGGDDPNETNDMRQLMTALKGSRRFLNGRFRSTLGYFFSETQRSHENFHDSSRTDSMYSSFQSESQKAESESEWLFNDEQGLRLNLQWKKESGGSETLIDQVNYPFARDDQSSIGEGLTFFSEGQTWFGEAGVRSDQHSRVGTVPTYRLVAGRNFAATTSTLRITSARGIKIPSLYQLYSEYGNRDLDFEISDALEISWEQKFSNQLSGSMTIFENQNRELIDFDAVQSRYFNVAKSELRGVELLGDWKLSDTWAVEGDATYLEARNKETGEQLIRRPKYATTVGLRYSRERWTIKVKDRFSGARTDGDPTSFGNTIELPSYNVVDVTAEYSLSKRTQITARIENLFNRQYQEVAGYGTPELSAYGGIKGSF